MLRTRVLTLPFASKDAFADAGSIPDPTGAIMNLELRRGAHAQEAAPARHLAEVTAKRRETFGEDALRLTC